METNMIDPTSFATNHPLSVAMRTTGRYWFIAHSKLMSMSWQWSDAVPYGATDGATLLLNRDGINKLASKPNGAGLIAFLLVHEALHALLGHGWRLAKLLDPKTANVAADYIINAMIANRNREIGKEVFPLIEGVLLDEQLSGNNSAEQLYRILAKPQQNQEINPKPSQQQDDTNNDTNNDNNEDGDQDDSEDSEGNEQESSEDSTASDPDSGGDSATDTDELDSGDDLSDFVGTGAPDTFEPEAEDGESKQEVIDRIEEANDSIFIADEIDRRQQGDKGTTANRLQSQRTSSSLSWPDLLREWLTKRSRNGWDAPFNNPIFQTTGLIAAGRRTRNAGEIVLVLDTSGSIGQRTYDRFLSEAQAVLDDLKPDKLHLLSVSHVVADDLTLEVGDTVPAKLKGGGGTKFKPAFDWVAEHAQDVDVMVYLTDGYSDDRKDITDVEFPLLWLSTGARTSDFKAGEVIEITDV
jgi:predicted metal-dependent peptidase